MYQGDYVLKKAIWIWKGSRCPSCKDIPGFFACKTKPFKSSNTLIVLWQVDRCLDRQVRLADTNGCVSLRGGGGCDRANATLV